MTDPRAAELLPCPFCGARAAIAVCQAFWANDTELEERVARAVAVARELNPETLHQNYGPDEPVDATLSNGKTAHYGWRHHVAVAKAAIATCQSTEMYLDARELSADPRTRQAARWTDRGTRRRTDTAMSHEPRFCKDCRFSEMRDRLRVCSNPLSGFEPVEGTPWCCTAARLSSSPCGYDGKLWAPKP